MRVVQLVTIAYMLTACARPVEIRHERVEVPVIVREPIPAELLKPMPDCVPPERAAWIDVAIALAECREQRRLVNRRLARIAEVGGGG